jgi:DNA-binding NarL/FixJ family response regulator
MIRLSPAEARMSRHDPTIVWIVEDNRTFRKGLASLVDEDPEMRCPVAVESCEEALAALGDQVPPDIVLMDIGLPGIDGIDGTREVRLHAPASRVIMLTVQEEDEKIFRAICAGASGYLLKPLPSEKILEAIRLVRAGAAPINAYIAKKVLEMFSRHAEAPDGAGSYGLTAREKEILSLLVDGVTMKGIAEHLCVSYHTIDTHLRNIYAKLHVHSRSAAVAKALREGLL